jgi:hypothetical protein
MTEDIPDARFHPMTSLAKAVGPLDGRRNLPLYQELQRALRKCVAGDGLPVRRQGSGNLVSSLSEDVRARVRTPRSVWLKRAAVDTYNFVVELGAST